MAVVTGSVVVLCGSKDIVVLPPSPPSTVEAEALALACDVLNACVVAFVVSPEKFESAKRKNYYYILEIKKKSKKSNYQSKHFFSVVLRVFKRFAAMAIPMTLCLFDIMHSIVGGGCFIGVCYYSITLPVVVPNEELGSVTTDTVQLV